MAVVYVSNIDGFIAKITSSLFNLGGEIKNSASKISKNLKDKIKKGLDANGDALEPISDVTMTLPIRFASERITRPNGPPLVATGKSVDSIGYISKGNHAEVGPQSDRGKLTFGENAYASGNRAKPRRDPIVVSEEYLDIVEDEILRKIDRVINDNS